MQLTVLGGCGAWPTAVQACSGYLVEYAGFRLLIDPGFATLPSLLHHSTVDAVDAVLVSHGHPDHCADLNPLLRARGLSDDPPPALPVYAPHGAVDAVLALDKPSMLAKAYHLHEFGPGDRFDIGPFTTDTWLLPHFVPNVGIRLATPEAVLAYTGDTGPSPDIPRLAQGADLFLSEATYIRQVPTANAPYLLTARLAGQYAHQAGAARLLLTHLWPGTDPAISQEAAAEAFTHPLGIAAPGLVTNLRDETQAFNSTEY
ncbi:MBL fold metallo-hydrolase [Streptomyces sp. UNOC14_S4]|uniref:MBL fold metallo-hydrolase n=1 Tax=Streptomyces sp. UNOC14_S4 TaxID=2872340 RepID=UPI001E542890|nr:MBL fold metallo-hydrolase [Streptomyces sp. UNOC14_S4]MCC3772968.1 MBL fold metallo-hydrolase [Streptomyces sp. UNOC14_S4]